MDTLTLTTGHPKGSVRQRLILKAELGLVPVRRPVPPIARYKLLRRW